MSQTLLLCCTHGVCPVCPVFQLLVDWCEFLILMLLFFFTLNVALCPAEGAVLQENEEKMFVYSICIRIRSFVGNFLSVLSFPDRSLSPQLQRHWWYFRGMLEQHRGQSWCQCIRRIGRQYPFRWLYNFFFHLEFGQYFAWNVLLMLPNVISLQVCVLDLRK